MEPHPISRLPLCLSPQPGELVTSWLIRLAAAHGLTTPVFCNQVSGRLVRFNRDMDGVCGMKLVETMARHTGLDAASIRAHHSLAGLEGRLFPRSDRATVPRWILPMGKPTDRLPFLQYCPLCLDAEIPYFRRPWRLSLFTICTLHGTGLLNACAACGAGIDPVKADTRCHQGRKPLCWRCGRDLRRCKATGVEEADVNLTLHYERLLAGATGLQVGSDEVSTEEYFRVLAPLCARLIRNKQRLLRWRKLLAEGAGVDLPEPLQRHSTSGFDTLSDPVGRRSVLRAVTWGLEDWPERFLKVARDAGARTSDFVMLFDQHPKWFMEPLQTLLTPTRHAPPPSEGMVRAQRKRDLVLAQRPNWCPNRQARIVRALRAAEFYSLESGDKSILRSLRFVIAKLRSESVGHRRRATLEVSRNTPIWRELQRLARPFRKDRCSSAEEIQRGIRLLCQEGFLSAYDLSELLGRCQEVLKAKHLTVMVREGWLETRFGPTSSGFRNNPRQAYRSVSVGPRSS